MKNFRKYIYFNKNYCTYRIKSFCFHVVWIFRLSKTTYDLNILLGINLAYIVTLIRPDSNFSNYNRVTKFDKATNESFRVTSIMADHSLRFLARF